jgi:hypothetical protein
MRCGTTGVWRRSLAVATVAVAVVMVSGCVDEPPDRRTEVDGLTAQLAALPGVRATHDELSDSPAQGRVAFTIHLDVADDVTADQFAAIVGRYLQGLHAADYTGYRAELDARHGWNVFSVDSGYRPLANGDQIVEQARDWIALRHAFTGAAVTLRATVVHPDGPLAIQEWGHSNAAALQLPDPADYTAVAEAVSTLSAKFADLNGLDWTISSGRQRPAEIDTSRRLPTAHELGVWNRLNADQSIAHTDRLRINASTTPQVWIAEATTGSRELNVALRLARQHLPIAATLAPPLLYTASDQLSGHIGGQGQAIGPVAITIGGCTTRDPLTYQPTDPERALIAAYERCHP